MPTQTPPAPRRLAAAALVAGAAGFVLLPPAPPASGQHRPQRTTLPNAAAQRDDMIELLTRLVESQDEQRAVLDAAREADAALAAEVAAINRRLDLVLRRLDALAPPAGE